jgi:sortase (surface protein transpeptidase)
VAVVVLLLVGAGFIVAGLRGRTDPMAGHPSAFPAAASTAAVEVAAVHVAAAAHPAVAAHSVPVSLRIPAIGVSVSLSTLGLNADGSPQVPTKYQQPGWYKLGPAPGQTGSAVILGHVDDQSGPAVFFKLGTLKAGDKVDVSLTDGVVVHFAVTDVATYLKAQFPSQKVYGSHGYSGLQLVTCGGKFDTATGHYLSNVVAFTKLVSTTPAAKG